MQEFTFHRTAERLRWDVRMWQIAVLAEAVVMIAMGIAVEKPAGYYILVFSVFYIAFVTWLYSRPLRRRHRLTETALTLVEKGGKTFVIPRERIKAVEQFAGVLPRGVSPITYKYVASEDTLYILPDKKNLVLITLREPVTARLTPRIVVEFTRVVCLVDEPDAFIRALLPVALAVPTSPPDQTMALGADAEEDTKPIPIATQGFNPAQSTREPGVAALAVHNLTKRFNDFAAVDRLTLQVAPGEICGFLGSNGAGKSTTIKMVVGLLRPTSGQVLICGQDPWRTLQARRLVGYVPDTPMLYENLTALEYLWLVGGLYELPESEVRDRAREVLQQVGLARQPDQPIRSCSLGMKRKLSIAAALMHRPRVLILDEATNGLDPRAAREVKDLIRAAAQQGTAVLLATHLLDVVAELADRIAIIDQGVLKACGTLAELQRALGRPQAALEELFLLATDRNGKEVPVA